MISRESGRNAWAAAAFLLLSFHAFAQDRVPRSFARECEKRLKPSVVRIEGVPVAPNIDTSKSYRELTAMASKEEATWVLGLTRPVLRVETQWGFEGLEESDGRRVCLRPSLRMTLRYDPVTVFVGREFVDDDCSYGFILAHETRHVVVHVRQLERTVALLKDQLQRRIGGEIHYGTRSRLEKSLRSEIQDYWIPRAERELKNVRREHAEIDTVEEYARAGKACQGRIARVIRGREDP